MPKKHRMLFLQNNHATQKLLEDTGEIEVVLFSDMKGDYRSVNAVFFDGGGDVDPSFYGDTDKYCLGVCNNRDKFELGVFQRTRYTHYHFGICRGSQLLWVANGGKLWQDITGHALAGTHGLFTEGPLTPEIVLNDGVTSTHHQAARITKECAKDRVLAYESYGHAVTAKSPGYFAKLDRVVEAHWHSKTRSLGVQGHPEYARASHEYKSWVIDQLLVNPATCMK